MRFGGKKMNSVKPLLRVWQNAIRQEGIRYKCGYCGTDTSPATGWHTDRELGFGSFCLICTFCNKPSFIQVKGTRVLETTPQAMMGSDIVGLPTDIDALYNEARKATGSGAYTAAVLTCRKILMHVAVEKGASPDLSFLQYVNFLAEENIIPNGGRDWVDYIRRKSNEANHEINIMSLQDAEDLVTFTEMLLRMTYEFSHRLKSQSASSSTDMDT